MTLVAPSAVATVAPNILIAGFLARMRSTTSFMRDCTVSGVALPSHTIAYAEEVGQAHVRARLRVGDGAMLNAIAFRAAGKPLGNALIANRGRNVHAAGTLSIDRWNGEERVQLRLMDVAPVEHVAR